MIFLTESHPVECTQTLFVLLSEIRSTLTCRLKCLINVHQSKPIATLMVIAIAPAEIFIDFLLGASTFAERLVREQIVKLLPEWISSQAVLILVCVAILWCDQSLNHEH